MLVYTMMPMHTHYMPTMSARFPCSTRREESSCCTWLPWALLFCALFPSAVASCALFVAKVFLSTLVTMATFGIVGVLMCGLRRISHCSMPCPAKCLASNKWRSQCRSAADRPRCSVPVPIQTTEIHVGQVSGMSSSSGSYELAIEIPGLRQEDLNVSVEEGLVIVRGETTVGRRAFKIDRLYQFPEDANIDQATAAHTDGRLIFTVPRRAQSAQMERERRPIVVHKRDDGRAAPSTSLSASETELVGAAAPSASVLLTECEANESNVQHPDEEVEEHSLADSLAGALSDGAHETASLGADEASLGAKGEEFEAIKDEWRADWDSMLDDLCEMGFQDRESNRIALSKHSGSVKLAVKELMACRTVSA